MTSPDGRTPSAPDVDQPDGGAHAGPEDEPATAAPDVDQPDGGAHDGGAPDGRVSGSAG